ncbi:hypothetical protein [Pseudomonas putida]|uniref:hypothetical protein n=1 Tax=Pseudomonas putida TaxID=303 RepID=UPI00300EB568
MRILIGAAGLALLAGCWTSPITAEKADPVPTDRQHWMVSGADSRLVVTRDGGLFGAGCNYRFFIDGKLAAEFAAGEVAAFGVSAGKHILSATPSSACGGGAVTEREIDIVKGESMRRRISLTAGGIDISPTGF